MINKFIININLKTMKATKLLFIFLCWAEVPASVAINGSQLTAGMYLYALIIDNQVIDTKKMILTE